jgi:hypothetical protein
LAAAEIAMIRNGLYLYSSKALDGVDGGADGVMILRDGTILGGTEFFYFVGTYTCSNGKWKGEFTNEEHTPAPIMRPMAGRGTVSIGFSGTYTDKVPDSISRHLLANEASNTRRLYGCSKRVEWEPPNSDVQNAPDGYQRAQDIAVATGKRHRASRSGRAPEKFIAAAYGAGRLRSRKQKDADHQPCCECPQA